MPGTQRCVGRNVGCQAPFPRSVEDPRTGTSSQFHHQGHKAHQGHRTIEPSHSHRKARQEREVHRKDIALLTHRSIARRNGDCAGFPLATRSGHVCVQPPEKTQETVRCRLDSSPIGRRGRRPYKGARSLVHQPYKGARFFVAPAPPPAMFFEDAARFMADARSLEPQPDTRDYGATPGVPSDSSDELRRRSPDSRGFEPP